MLYTTFNYKYLHISLIFSTFAYRNTRDNIQAELQVLRMENVRLTNELVKRNEYVSFLEDENKAIEEETRTEYESKLVLMKKKRDNALGKVKEAESESKNANAKADKDKMRAAGDKYGQMVHRAVDYILDDEDAFRTFLSDGRIDMHNIAIERCFRHIAMGRRNWLQTGSHFSAQNLAFMFGLLESCKLNKVNFGEYIEDILTRILCGEEVDASFLPCDYVRHFEDGTDAEVTKTSQAVA